MDIIVVIPSCGEAGNIEKCLKSLNRCDFGVLKVELIIIVNDGFVPTRETKKSNLETIRIIEKIQSCTKLNFKIDVKYITQGIDGVGMARKLGMDLASERLSFNRDKIIVCLDADCTVSENYFQAINQGFVQNSKMDAASIRFEHGLTSEAIVKYELHLRYFIDIQRHIHLPFAIQTVGSAMAVRADAYKKQGGMNRRQAGEDFYFLQKYISIDKCFEINDTIVFPSERKSNRVPFGTGKAINDIEQNEGVMMSYNPNSFYVIENFLTQIFLKYPNIENINVSQPSLMEYLEGENYSDKLQEILRNSTDIQSFTKRFFQWFNAFRLMKCLHYMEDKIPLEDAVSQYMNDIYTKPWMDNRSALQFFREKAYKNSNAVQP